MYWRKMIRGEGMSTTEDYLDQLLRSASGEVTEDTGEQISEVPDEDGIIPLESDIDEQQREDGLSLEQAMDMSVDDVLDKMESMNKTEPQVPEEETNGMMSEEAIAAMFAANEATEPEEVIPEEVVPEEMIPEEVPEEVVPKEMITEEIPEEVVPEEIIEENMPEEEPQIPEEETNGMMSEEAIAAMFAANEATEPEAEEEPEEVVPKEMITEEVPEEVVPEEMIAGEEPEEVIPEEIIEENMPEEEPQIPEEETNGMMSEEAIAAMFAANEATEPEAEMPEEVVPEEMIAEEVPEEVVPEEMIAEEEPEEIIEENMPEEEPQEAASEISLDDMLADMREETTEPIPIIEETAEEEPQPETEDDGSILDLLNMMSEDEDLKDIGDLLKSDEDGVFDLSEDDLFGETSQESEEEPSETTEEEPETKKQGFFAKLFGKNKGKESGSDGDENEQIIKEVEEEIKEEDKKEEEKKKKKKDKKNKKVKNKGKEAQEGDEEQEAETGKKAKKVKKKKEKPPKVKEITPKEPPLPKKPVVLIMLMAASILALVLLSRSVLEYQSSISKADSSFINRNYEEAYENILGVKVKEEDKQLYDRIRVMMKLEGKYKMYLSHIEQNQYDEALNDLIVGVIKYEQYKKDAESLGIQQAFDDEFALIEEQLNVVFGVDAGQAKEWYNTLSALDYTETVRSVIKAAGYSVEESGEDEEDSSDDLSQFGVEEVE